jgi:glycosyltransferase involved in cell wall biosynthesis
MIPVLYWSNYSELTQGGQKSLFYIMQDVDRLKYFPVLACQYEGTLTAKARELNIPVEIVKLPPSLRIWHLISIIKFIRCLSHIINKHGIKIVHSEELRVVFMAYFVKLFKNIKLIWHVRVLWQFPVQNMIGLFISDVVVCVSKAVADNFQSRSKKLIVVISGVDSEEFIPFGARAESELFTKTDILIGQVGTLVDHKKPHILLRAAPFILRNFPDVKFILIGTGKADYTLYLKNLVKELGIERSVIFWGQEPNIAPLVNRLNIFCLLSQSEGLSRALMEAMSLEKTIVTSDIPQNRELIQHNVSGMTAKLDSPEDTAFQINKLLADKIFATRLGKTARQHIIDDFPRSRNIIFIHYIYEQLAGSR